MKHRRLFCFRPLAAHAEGHLKVTTIVVVVIDIYLYDYYPAASCITVVLPSREEVLADFAQKWGPAL